MKKSRNISLVVFFLFVAFLASCSIHIDRNKTSEGSISYDLTDFDKIIVNGNINVVYTQDSTYRIKVDGPSEVLKDINVDVDGNRTLYLSTEKELLFDRTVDEVTVYVSSPDIIGGTITGSGSLSGLRPIDTDTLSLAVTGSGDIYFPSVVCDKIDDKVTGSGEIAIDKVNTQFVNTIVTGSGSVTIDKVNTRFISASVSGSGYVDVTGKWSKITRENLTGSGEIRLNEE